MLKFAREIELLQLYFNDELPLKEREKIEKRLAEDSNYRQEVDAYFQLFEGFQRMQEEPLRNQMMQWDSDIENAKSASNIRPMFRRLLSYAAAILIVCCTIVYMWKNDDATRYASLYETNFMPAMHLGITVRGSASSPGLTEQNLQLKKAYNAYKIQNYEKAVDNFEQILRTANLSQVEQLEMQYYLGIAYLSINNVDKGIKIFTELAHLDFGSITFEDSAFIVEKHQVLWYLALANLKKGNKLETIRNLNSIKKEEGIYFSKKAQKLLEELVN